MRRYAFLLLAVISAIHQVSASSPVSLTGARWSEDAEGHRVLLLEFSSAPIEVEVAADMGGVTLRVPAVSVAPAVRLPPELELRGNRDAVTIRMPGSGLEILWMQVSGRLLRLRVGSASRRPGYRLGAGDVVFVGVYQEPDLSGEYRVAQDGTIHIPLAGDVLAAGLTETELATRLRDRLKKFLVDPQVSVAIRSFESQFVYVTGAVSQAKKIALRPGRTVQDVLAEAGVALVPGQKVVLNRLDSNREVIHFTAEELDMARIPLKDGDVLTVREPGYVYVRGEVRNPQKIVHRPGLTLQQAITEASGLTDWANKKRVTIQRREGERVRTLVVNLRQIEEGREPDPHLWPRDVIVVARRGL